MEVPPDPEPSRKVLVVSQRNVAQTPANAVLYEFEDLIVEWENAQLLEIESYHGSPVFDARRTAYQGLRLLGSPASKALGAASVGRELPLGSTNYDLVFMITSTAFDLFTLAELSSLRRRAKKIVVCVAETWPETTNRRKLRLEPWDLVDHIFVGVPSAAGSLADDLGREVRPLPLGVDTEIFGSVRSVDRPIAVVNPGRRSEGQHRQLLRVCDENDLWYHYDTIFGDMTVSAAEHRRSYVNLLARSHTAICNYARFNNPERIGGRRVVPYRVMEALGAGCRMIGSKIPDRAFHDVGLPELDLPELALDPSFDEVFDVLKSAWSDCDRDAYRQLARDVLDWSHRWAAVLEALDLPPTSLLTDRRKRISSNAADTSHGTV